MTSVRPGCVESRERGARALLDAFASAFTDLTVLITGHTGFKGSWLSIWLRELGARVVGYSLDPPTTPSNFQACRLADRMIDVRGDVRDVDKLRHTIEQHRPQVLFHLAAQPIVLESYREPKETFDVNVSGTVNVLEAVRSTSSVQALVCITTDKVYADQEWLWGYREDDRLGGHDPYSASKAAAELVIASYRHSFFPPDRFAEHGVALASTRAGNVIGGGDWAPFRLVPDCMRALMSGKPMQLRNPSFIRPWQHVLEPLSGYLWLAVKLLQPDGNRFAEAWNFGSVEWQAVTSEELVRKAIHLWGSGSYVAGTTQSEAETAVLRLSGEKAAQRLNWRRVYAWEEALSATVGWFKRFQAQADHSRSVDMYGVCVEQIQAYTKRAQELELRWATT